MTPTVMWFRRDLRLTDNQALVAACAAGGPVIPVFIDDEVTRAQGAAPRFRLGLSVAALARDLEAAGSALVLRQGDALAMLREIIAQTGARQVHWNRLYDPASRARDAAVKSALRQDGIAAHSHAGQLLFEPWDVETKTGGRYKVYTPYWRAVAGRDPGAPLATPGRIPAPASWPPLGDALQMDQAMNRGAEVLRPHCTVGAAAAQDRLGAFTQNAIGAYKTERDYADRPATSGLSENLTYGEISPRQVWQAGWAAHEAGAAGAEHFVKELVWREFAYHLMDSAPDLATRSWRDGWEEFPWQGATPEFTAWCQGRTGVRMVDAGMRQLQARGIMHNRVRMIAASYLTKHLMVDWRMGLAWFADQLIDWDPAANAMGWQWVAGCGPDASPYFRVFNPDTQAEKFDPSGAYRRAYIAEGQEAPPQSALDFFRAVPRAWGMSPTQSYPAPVVGLAEGRARALAAYETHKQNNTINRGEI